MSGRYGDVSGTYADKAGCYCADGPAVEQAVHEPAWLERTQRINAILAECMAMAVEMVGLSESKEPDVPSREPDCAAAALGAELRRAAGQVDALHGRLMVLKDKF